MGGFDTRLLGLVEPTVRYHPAIVVILTCSPDRGEGHSKTGSLTGAVSSQNVTEEFEGHLSMVGNHASSAMVYRWLNCETYKSSRCESRP